VDARVELRGRTADQPKRPMDDPIDTRIDIGAVAALAGLALAEDEAPRFARELARAVDWVTALDRVPTDGVEPMRYPSPTPCALRPDDPGPALPAEEALALAPEAARGLYAVPRVL